MEIVEISKEDKRWPIFLQQKSHKIYHTPLYKEFLEESFSCKLQIIAAVDEEKIHTLLPIAQIKSKIFGNKVISTPYIEYGGFAGDDKHIKDILEYAKKKYSKNNQYLEIRGGIDSNNHALSRLLQKENLYKRFVLLLQSEEENFKQIQKSKRKAIKKSLRELEVKDIPKEDISQLYSLYCQNMKRFGSPPYNKRFFENFYNHLISKELGKAVGSYKDGKLASALLGFCYQDTVHILIAVADSRYQQYRPSDAMHWTFIKWACDNEYKYFDFGRVREESGQYEYKRKWGPQLYDLPSYFDLWNTKEVPKVDPASAKYKLMVSTWKKFPTPLTKVIGHKLRRELGI